MGCLSIESCYKAFWREWKPAATTDSSCNQISLPDQMLSSSWEAWARQPGKGQPGKTQKLQRLPWLYAGEAEFSNHPGSEKTRGQPKAVWDRFTCDPPIQIHREMISDGRINLCKKSFKQERSFFMYQNFMRQQGLPILFQWVEECREKA